VEESLKRVEGNIMVWRPWQLKQLELLQVDTISTSFRRHLTQEYTLFCAQSGAASFQYRNMRFNSSFINGAFCIVEPGETWSCQLKDTSYHRLSLDPAWLQQFASEMLHREQPLPHFSSHDFVDPSLRQAVYGLAARSQAPASRLQQEETLLHLLASLLLSHTEDAEALPRFGWEHPAVKQAKEYLQGHYTEEVSLQELARVVNMSPFHLSHVFRLIVGLPPHAYQTQLRLAHARRLLAQGYSVGYVAQETGFFDQSHFTQLFKRRFLITPGSYRKTVGLS
jgi:AraC-like DNA-binding protein